MNNLILIEQQIKDNDREIDNLKKRLRHYEIQHKELVNQQAKDFARVLEWFDESKRNNTRWHFKLLAISIVSIAIVIYGVIK